MKPAISARNIGKQYNLGLVHTDLLSEKLGLGLRAMSNRFRKPKSQLKAGVRQQENSTFWALKDISFEVQPGEVIGIIGRNGAGKSTLLKVLSRITSPTTGEIKLAGRLASLLEVGTGFHPELTGRENIFLNGAILGMRRNEVEQKFDEIVAFSGIEQFIDTPVKRYSSGMYVRLAFAVAAHLESDIMVIDEVLAVGDAEFQKRCLGKMKDVSSSGRTVLFVSHNLSSIRKLCSSGLLLHEGRVHFRGGIDETLSTYLSMARSRHGQDMLSMPRPGWATPLISSVSLVDKSRNPVKEVSQGSNFLLQMSFEPQTNRPVLKPVMGITIKNSMGELVGSVNSRMTASEFPKISSGQHDFQCELTAPPLVRGTYLVDFWLGDGPENIDVLEDVLEFSVIDSDIYDTGISPFPNMGSVFFHPTWSLSVT